MLSIVVAVSRNHVIGADNALPWYLPADLRHFKQLTLGHTVVMGRRTFESILVKLGHPLPDRHSVVVTRDINYRYDKVQIVHDVYSLTELADDIFVIGGAQIYRQTMAMADRIYVTEIHADIQGDTVFPEIGPEWREVSREKHSADDKNPYDYDFVVYERV